MQPVFQQTVYSFKAFKEAIEDYSTKAERYTDGVCHLPQSVNLTFTEGAFIFLVPVTLLLAPGQTVALVGPSGGGKTTAASLIPRFWDVSSGSVTVGAWMSVMQTPMC